jgi:hypothetical protein
MARCAIGPVTLHGVFAIFSPHGEECGQRPRVLRLSKDEPWPHRYFCDGLKYFKSGTFWPLRVGIRLPSALTM